MLSINSHKENAHQNHKIPLHTRKAIIKITENNAYFCENVEKLEPCMHS